MGRRSRSEARLRGTNRVMIRRVGLVGCLLLSCREPSPPVNEAPLVRTASAASSATVLVSSAPGSAAPTEEQWVESMRSGISAKPRDASTLPTPVRVQDPDVRYARARGARARRCRARARPARKARRGIAAPRRRHPAGPRRVRARGGSVRRRGAIFCRAARSGIRREGRARVRTRGGPREGARRARPRAPPARFVRRRARIVHSRPRARSPGEGFPRSERQRGGRDGSPLARDRSAGHRRGEAPRRRSSPRSRRRCI